MTFEEAYANLPADAILSFVVGYPGVGGFHAYYRRPNGERWEIANGAYNQVPNWTCFRKED